MSIAPLLRKIFLSAIRRLTNHSSNPFIDIFVFFVVAVGIPNSRIIKFDRFLVIRDNIVIEPRTITRLPLFGTSHAKLGFASACHVVTTIFQLHDRRAIVASLPAVFFRHCF